MKQIIDFASLLFQSPFLIVVLSSGQRQAKAGYSFDGRQVGIKILATDKLVEIMRAVEAV